MRPRPSSRLAVVTASALLIAACGQEQDTSDRRPIGQQPSASGGQQMPEDHPDVGQMGGMGAGGDSVDPRARAGMSETTIARIDSGNTAYRAGDYEEARRLFRAVARERPESGAAWFGVYMAERALGNDAAADSALERAGGMGDASRMHAAPGDSADDGSEGTSPPGAGGEGG